MSKTVQQISDELASNLGYWTFETVEERMTEALRIWWRTPGRVGPSKGSPFASDIPAELIVAEDGDWGGDGVDGASSDAPIRSAAMTRVEVAERDTASDWMSFVPERDRKLVGVALGYLARDEPRVPWMRVKRDVGVDIGAGGLERRYSRAIAGIANKLNRSKQLFVENKG